MWRTEAKEERWPSARHVVLVNLLHEIPLDTLPVFLANVLSIVPLGGTVLLYELQQLKSVEDSYVVWFPEDICEIFRRIGFATVLVTGRTQSKRRSECGYLYIQACGLRVHSREHSKEDLTKIARYLYERRLDTLRRRIEITLTRLRGRLATDAVRLDHFHAVHSLVNCYRQLR